MRIKMEITGNTIEDAWRSAIVMCLRFGSDFLVRGGSYVGQVRKQIDYVTIFVREPYIRPLSPILPPHLPQTLTDDRIDEYFIGKIVGCELSENQSYTYGQFILPQLMRAISLLISSNGGTNQATITVGDPNSIFLDDPPCMRAVSFKVIRGSLQMALYFRSWDLIAGLPENLGGLQLLKEFVLSYLIDSGMGVKDGPIIAFSDGLHIYDQYAAIAESLCLDLRWVIDPRVAQEKNDFIMESGI
jgi:thymidylate synthase